MGKWDEAVVDLGKKSQINHHFILFFMFRVLRNGHLCLEVASAVKGAHRILSLLSKNYWSVWGSLATDDNTYSKLYLRVLDVHVNRRFSFFDSFDDYTRNGIIHFQLPNGRVHRGDDLPAIIWSGGTRAWWINGKQHRYDGKPAVIWPYGRKEKWVHGVFLGTE